VCLATGSGSPEVHSYDPGINPVSPDGLFWITQPCVISPDDIVMNLSDGTATFQFNNIELFDWTTLANSLTSGALVPGTPTKATMSATVQWSDVARRFQVDDTTNGFGGNFIETKATFSVSTQNADGSSFSGTGDSTIATAFGNFAEIGVERNGVFFG
jgi:hypothetical protein